MSKLSFTQPPSVGHDSGRPAMTTSLQPLFIPSQLFDRTTSPTTFRKSSSPPRVPASYFTAPVLRGVGFPLLLIPPFPERVEGSEVPKSPLVRRRPEMFFNGCSLSPTSPN